MDRIATRRKERIYWAGQLTATETAKPNADNLWDQSWSYKIATKKAVPGTPLANADNAQLFVS